MASGTEIVGVMIAATVVLTLFTPISGIIDDTTSVTQIQDEEVVASNSSFVQLDGYKIHQDSDLVQYKNATSVWVNASEGTDYEMDYEDGAIKALVNGSIEDGETIRVSYDYKKADGATATILLMVPLFMALVVMVTFKDHM